MMPTAKPNICLNMIVKNESAIMTRCLDSVRNLIDYWVICDTGSTDGTQQLIRDYFAQHQIDGQLLEHTWQDFAHNRNLALDNARDKARYILLMDADDYLVNTEGFHADKLVADCYRLKLIHGNLNYFNTKLIRADLPWYWEGVLHEYLECDIPYSIENWQEGCHIVSPREGARSRNPNKYQDDARVLRKALAKEPGNTRYRFYLAQSHRDYGNHREALKHYQKRADMGGWEEEAWYASLQTALLKQELQYPETEVIQTYLKAYERRPQRAESLYYLSRYLRERGRYALAYVYATAAAHTPLPPGDVLFVASSVYAWQAKDELAVTAYWTGHYQQCIDLCDQLLSSPALLPAHRARITDNLQHAHNQLQQTAQVA